MLTIWQARAQRCAGARERARLPFGRRARSAVRVYVSGCAYHLAGVRSALRVHVSGCAYHLAACGGCPKLLRRWAGAHWWNSSNRGPIAEFGRPSPFQQTDLERIVRDCEEETFQRELLCETAKSKLARRTSAPCNV